MNHTIFEGIRGDNENFIVLLYDFDLCQNSAHIKLHSSKAEQCTCSLYLYCNLLLYFQDLRHACNHPYIRGKRPDSGDPDREFSEDIIDVCGKMQVLHQMLKRLSNEGHKTLVFSQFTSVLDLIAASLDLKGN